MSEVWTVLSILNWTTDFFAKHGVDSPRLDAELLLARVLEVERIQLYVQYDRPLGGGERDRFRALVKRRAAGEPVQYILGAQEFWSIPLEVTRGVLIPRPDTEIVVEEALACARALAEAEGLGALRIAEVGTGSGAIAIALAKELTDATVWAGDIAAAPLAVAPANAQRAALADRVLVHEACGLTPLWHAANRAPFHLVASNPPYIRTGDYPGLMREVRDWEPREALVAGPEGLDVYRTLIAEAAAPGVLHPTGSIVLEIGDGPQADAVSALLRAAGFRHNRVREDYARRPRVVVATRQSE